MAEIRPPARAGPDEQGGKGPADPARVEALEHGGEDGAEGRARCGRGGGSGDPGALADGDAVGDGARLRGGGGDQRRPDRRAEAPGGGKAGGDGDLGGRDLWRSLPFLTLSFGSPPAPPPLPPPLVSLSSLSPPPPSHRAEDKGRGGRSRTAASTGRGTQP
jgi:hypothetical protein